ncbi:MAG: aspartate aminotransferase family protein [Flavobacteriales bacterium]
MNIEQKIKQLEKAGSSLEPDAEKRSEDTNKVLDHCYRYLDKLSDENAFHGDDTPSKKLLEEPIGESFMNMDDILSVYEESVEGPGINAASGGHLGYIPGGGVYHSALGDYLAAVTNKYAGVYFGAPGAVKMENMLIDWVADLIGYEEGFAGNLTSGGSIANLIGIVTAREAYDLKGKDLENTVIYASPQMHHCLNKAIRIAGLKECKFRNIELDQRHRIDTENLENLIEQDKKKGLNPWLVIASAGTTDVGTVDPMDKIGKVTEKHKLWFHLDAAYGGFFKLCDEAKDILKGMERSDSIVVDPHKGLFLAYGIGAVIVKNKEYLHKAHSYTADYMQDALNNDVELSPADLSPELTKHFRALRMWLPLKSLGIKPFKACVEEKLWLARYFYKEINKIEGYVADTEPDLSVVIFHYKPNDPNSEELNKKIVKKIHEDGRIFISSTRIGGKYSLRVAILSFRTHKREVDILLGMLKDYAKEV